MMKKLLIALLLSSPAFAELPPPGTARSGEVTVDPNNLGVKHKYDLKEVKVIPRESARAYNLRTNKEIADLKRKVKELENELALKPRTLPAPIQRTSVVERTVEKRTIAPWTLYGIVGTLPDGVHVDRDQMSREATVNEYGQALGLGGMYHFESGFALGLMGQMATRDTHLKAFSATAGYSFGSR